MSMQLIKTVNKKHMKRVPKVKTGQTVRIHQKIKEGEKERIQIFEGLIIKISSGSETSKTFTVRRVFQGIGVEKIFPLHSPNIAKIEIVKSSKIRRAKLYYMRKLTGKAARLKEKLLSAKDLEEMEAEMGPEEVAEESAPVETEASDTPATETAEVAAEAAPAKEEPKEEQAEAKQEAPAEENKEEEKAE